MRISLNLPKVARFQVESARAKTVFFKGEVVIVKSKEEKRFAVDNIQAGNERILGKLGIKNQKGFTLVELITAIALGAVFIMAVSTLLINSSRIAQRSRDVAVANSFAENKVEALRSAGYLGLPAADTTTNITGELPNELAAPRNASLSVTQQSISIKKVLISIEYNDQGAQKTYSYTTYLGELGVGQY